MRNLGHLLARFTECPAVGGRLGQRAKQLRLRRQRGAHLRPIWGPAAERMDFSSASPTPLSLRQLTNDRVPEHAPFYVYGIWVVRSDAQHAAP